MQDNTVPKEPEELQNNNEVIESPNVTSSTKDQVTSIPPETIQPSNPEEPVSSDYTIEQENNSATEPTAQPVAPTEQVINTSPIQENITPTITNAPVMAPSVGVALEPTKKKSSKKLILVIGAIFTILLASVAGVLAYLSSIPSPAEHLQNAINTSAQTQSLQQVYEVKSSQEGSEIKGNVTMQNDFSDPAVPKSIGNFDIDVSVFGIAIKVKSDFLCVSETECYIKYNDFTIPEELSTEKPAFLGQWLKFNPYDDTSAETADPFQLITGLNTVLGEVITGNITGNAKDEIAKYAANGTTYTFSSSSEEQIDGKTAIKYDLALNASEILNLNKSVATQYSLQNPLTTTSDISQRVTLWVDKDTDRIVKVSYDEDDIQSTILFSKFNEKPEIKAPSEYLNPEEYNAIL